MKVNFEDALNVCFKQKILATIFLKKSLKVVVYVKTLLWSIYHHVV